MEALLPHFHERREGSHFPTQGAVSLRDRRRCSRRLGDLLEQAGALVSGQSGSETLLARCGGRQPTSASDGGGLASRNSERRSSQPPGRNHGTSSGDDGCCSTGQAAQESGRAPSARSMLRPDAAPSE